METCASGSIFQVDPKALRWSSPRGEERFGQLQEESRPRGGKSSVGPTKPALDCLPCTGQPATGRPLVSSGVRRTRRVAFRQGCGVMSQHSERENRGAAG